ncbi:MAG: hypothetical protein ACOCYP_05780 [Planctomycetota bacterium]
MHGFIRTLFLGLSVLSILIVGIGLTVALLFAQRGGVKGMLKQVANSPKENEALRQLARRPDEPAPLPQRAEGADYERVLQDVAQRINEVTVRELVERNKQKAAELAERERYLAQREAELRLGQSDMMRLQRQLEALRHELRDRREELAARQEAFARSQLETARQVEVLDEVERERAQELARTYAMMRDPWQQLRQLAPNDIARFLALMEPKAAAEILDAAVADREMPGVSTRIHRALLALDLSGMSGSQAQRLATLYNYMKPKQILPYLADSEPAEVARILLAMEVKQRAALKEAIHAADPERGAAVDRALQVEQLRAGDGGGV